MSASDVAERLILDGTKLPWHMDRVRAWDRGERIAPITIDMALTQACSAGCSFCVREDQQISLYDGSRRAIRDIRVGDRVLSLSTSGDVDFSVVTNAWLVSRAKHCLTLSMQCCVLSCTDDHLILTESGWRLAREISIGEKIVHVCQGASCSQAEDVGRQKPDLVPVLSIERDAVPSPVYDIECWPYHNFIASSVVVHNCYAALQVNKPRKITVEHMRAFLWDCADIGVKGVSFVSDGESTLSPAYAPSIEYGHELGLSMASGTWGGPLTHDTIDRVLPCLTYLRLNVSGGTPERTAQIMGITVEQHMRVRDIIRYCVAEKARLGLPVTIGIQMVLMPQDADQIIPFAQLALDLGVDYGVIKHCSDDENGSLGVDYSKYPALYGTLKEAESMRRDSTDIVVKWNKIKQGASNTRVYDRCFGAPFLLQISGTGLVAPCGMLFNDKYKSDFHIGNICDTRFRDIWRSERYWEVMGRLADPERFDPRKMCGSLCIQHLPNEALWRHKTGEREIVESAEAIPAHVNFV